MVTDHKYELLIVSIASPLLVGVYKDGVLIETISNQKQTSQILLPIVDRCMQTYNISHIIYTRGPGSYMAIKLTYIMLKTIEIIKGIKCSGCSGFELNQREPIKAVGNLYFIKEKETIITKKIEQPILSQFVLPQYLQDIVLDEESVPEYVLPAV
ncbi:MAG TPA: hypothetical protein CFH81_08595 [Sulfurovum sp. UBA12169]|nr:MAG TPA: hypothetical protein CFH81_08595 [Sulfurovum sp. UBA12169]